MTATPRTDNLVADCAMLIRRLCRAVKRCEPDNTLPDSAMDFLLRKGISGQILRDDDMPDVDIQELLQNCEDLNVKNAQLQQELATARADAFEECVSLCNGVRADHFEDAQPDAYLAAVACADAIERAAKYSP